MSSTRSVLAVAALTAGALAGPTSAQAAVGWSAPQAIAVGPAVSASVAVVRVGCDATVRVDTLGLSDFGVWGL